MKILLLGSAIFFMSQMCFGQSNNFYDKILRYDNCSYCYFIAVNVESKKYSGTIIVENNKFQDFFKKTKRLNKSQYIDFMKDVFESKKKIVLKGVYIDKSNLFLNVIKFSKREFRILKQNDETEKIALKGCVNFIKYYFLSEPFEKLSDSETQDCKIFISKQPQNLYLKRKTQGITEENAIIATLFSWQIPVLFDDYTGFLVLEPEGLRSMVSK